jgi:hypothetical protein
MSETAKRLLLAGALLVTAACICGSGATLLTYLLVQSNLIP